MNKLIKQNIKKQKLKDQKMIFEEEMRQEKSRLRRQELQIQNELVRLQNLQKVEKSKAAMGDKLNQSCNHKSFNYARHQLDLTKSDESFGPGASNLSDIRKLSSVQKY